MRPARHTLRVAVRPMPRSGGKEMLRNPWLRLASRGYQLGSARLTSAFPQVTGIAGARPAEPGTCGTGQVSGLPAPLPWICPAGMETSQVTGAHNE